MSRPRSTRINLAAIAERLGFSVSTVSRALRGVDGIHPETRTQIAALAHQMGYVLPGGSAAKTASNQLAAPQHVLALSQSNSPHTAQRFMAGMSATAAASNVAILSHLVSHDQCASVLEARTAPASFRSGLIKGVVLIHRWPEAVASAIAEKFPTVSIIHDYAGTNIDLIGIDDRRGMAELVHHLHAAGHRRIGFFGLCPEMTWSCSRYAAYVEALTRLDLEFNPRQVVRVDLPSALSAVEFSAPEAFDQVRTQLREGVDAWICASSMTGQSLCRYLLAQGVRLPDDMSLVTCHGASAASPPDLPVMTSTDIIDEELGAAAVRRLINRLETPEESRRALLVPARLRVGTTTRAPANGKG
jgi:LacI family transcriptional regulator